VSLSLSHRNAMGVRTGARWWTPRTGRSDTYPKLCPTCGQPLANPLDNRRLSLRNKTSLRPPAKGAQRDARISALAASIRRTAEAMLDGVEGDAVIADKAMTASRSATPSRIIAVVKMMDWIEGNKPN
jgi:hypothetical protein